MSFCMNCYISINRYFQRTGFNATDVNIEIVSIIKEWTGREITDSDRLCQECVQLIEQEANNRSVDPNNRSSRRVGHICCVNCRKSVLRKVKYKLPEGSIERKYTEMQIFPRQVPIEAWACYACWKRAKANSQHMPKLLQTISSLEKCEHVELQGVFDTHPVEQVAASDELSIKVLVKCVICLSPKANISIIQIKTEDKSYQDIFSFCLDLKVTESLKSLKLCEECYSKLLSFDKFKTLALKNYAYLNAILPTKCTASFKTLQENDCNEINPLDDIDDNNHIGDETNNEVEIKTEHDIKDEDLTENTLENKSECHEEYLGEEYLDEKCMLEKIKAVPEVILENFVSEEQLSCEPSSSSWADEAEESGKPNEIYRPKEICRKCGRCVWDITGHLQLHIPKSERSRPECDFCSKTYANKKGLRRHILLVHMENQPKSIHKICNNKEFRELEKHKLKVHFREQLFKCPECPQRFRSALSLKAHSRLKCGKTECDICHKELNTYNYMLEHKKYVHAKVAPYLCQICSKRFVREGKLKQHLRTHTNERPYKCETCGKAFSTSTGLSRHRERHTAERKYQCNMCGKKYLTKSYLASHIAQHTMPKIHPCQYCGRMFKRTDQRRAHEINLHEKRGEISLAECGKLN